jgi:F-type H+-transporting ATPase subunit b
MDLSNTILLAAETAEHVAEASEAAGGGLAGTLGINWKLFVAQIVNFAIVLFVLWKWVFGPVGSALEKRRERVEKSLKDAENIEKRVQEFERGQEERVAKARMEAEGIISKAGGAAAALKAQVQSEARGEAERIIRTAKQTIESEKQQAILKIREEAAELTVMATEKVLRAKLDEKGDRRLVEETLKEI